MDLDIILIFIGVVVATVLLALFAAKTQNFPKKKRRKRMRILLYIYILFLLAVLLSDFFIYGNDTESTTFTKLYFANPLGISTMVIILTSFAINYFRKGDADEDEEE